MYLHLYIYVYIIYINIYVIVYFIILYYIILYYIILHYIYVNPHPLTHTHPRTLFGKSKEAPNSIPL